ncbi:MAG TPA: MFS transporter [Hydrogenophaga sp.]|uniref:MFS transporter n=1 Tax=Hydrogenophaga sp. TaxID=1904254 RepID=UPI002B532594|nr:MFS transporter [Hydrogenophaga sp.]HMN91693.1 MFS transporter [Hydrogenophaga sp.]HMP11235.1 MFS transporter [Hydrogenophaga sp.]
MKPGTRSALARLIAAQICVHAGMTGFRMAAPLMALREGHSAAAVGVLLALFALSQVFLALPAGRFAQRYGLLKPFVLASLVATAGGLSAVMWPHFLVLCATALCSGAAVCLAMIALQRHVGHLATDATELRQVFSWVAIGPSISNFLGPFLAGLLIDSSGFRAAYLLLALLPSLAWWWVRRIPEHPASDADEQSGNGSSWNLLRDKSFRHLMLMNWVLSSCWDVHTFLVPVLGHERGLSATAIGSILGAFALAATAIRLLMPWLAARLHEATVIGTAMVGTALLFAVYPLVQVAWAMGLLSILLGVALGSVQPMVMSTLHQITPRHRLGEALGLRSMAINGSSVLMPLLFGSAGVLIGVTGVFWSVGLVVGAGSRLAWRMRAWSLQPHKH